MNNIFHVIKDPVHGTMQFTSAEDAWVKPFIDSANFQRLRHIKQLGLGDFIFPGAVHSRFNHSLGCCYVASQIAQKIGLTDDERQLVMIACLLHDVGHGPFSHAFEGIFKNKLILHEDWTPYFLQEYSGETFFQNYNALNPRYPLNQEKFHALAQMIMHQQKEKNVLADIVSSQLDADRLDYLLRDSHFCGVRYGEFDFRWMLHCMAIVETPEGKRLGITHKGIGVVEHYLMARRLMMRNIYHSQKKLAFEMLLVKLLANLAETLQETFAKTALIKSKLGQFLIAANQLNDEAKNTKVIEKLKKEFLQTHYAHYKELCDYDVFLLIRQLAELKEHHPAIQIAKRLQQRCMPKIVRLQHMDIPLVNDALQEYFAKNKDIADWQIMLIETPHRSYSNEEDPILVINEQKKINPIGRFSMMIEAISDKLEHTTFLAIDPAVIKHPAVVKLLRDLEL